MKGGEHKDRRRRGARKLKAHRKRSRFWPYVATVHSRTLLVTGSRTRAEKTQMRTTNIDQANYKRQKTHVCITTPR